MTEDNTPVSSWSLALWSAERVLRCLPGLSDLGGGNPADQQSQASTRLLSFSITSWASDSTHTHSQAWSARVLVCHLLEVS